MSSGAASLAMGMLSQGGNVFGNILSNLTNWFNTKKTNETNLQAVQDTNSANRQLAELQHQWNIDDWKMQTAYNSPAAQMERLRAAGLNPSLMYGQMNNSSPSFNSSSPIPMQANKAIPFLSSNPFESLDPLTTAQIANINADTEKKKGETTSQSIRNKVDGMNAEAFAQFYERYKEDIIHAMATDLGLKENEMALSNFERFSAAWDMAILFGLNYSEALKIGEVRDFYNGGFSLQEFLDQSASSESIEKMKERFAKANAQFIGGRDAEIAMNSAVKVINEVQEQKAKKDVDIWKFLNDKAKDGDKWEKVGAQVLLTLLFISEQHFNLPAPSFRFANFKRSSNKTVYDQSDRSRNTINYN